MFIRVSQDGRHFVRGSGERFIPWGFNYDHDAANRLIEYYWEKEWGTVVEDCREMKRLGANTVRIHLQVSRFMDSPIEPNRGNLRMLERLLAVAETNGLFLDITGLGCYDKPDVPKWYNDLPEAERWNVQARFWEAVAQTCQSSAAVFCYDLMNEPVVVSGTKVETDWTPGAFGDRYFVQRLNLDAAGRTQKEIAKAWLDKQIGAVRKHDTNHLITVGVIPWALSFPGAKPDFNAPEVGQNLDFVSVHFYPKSGEVDKALKALAVYDVGKPIVIEEMFPLSCSLEELNRFIEGSRQAATGWIGFYWGKTPEEYRRQEKRDVGEAITLAWLEYFATNRPPAR